MLKLIISFRPFAKYFLIFWLLTILTVSSIPNVPTLKLHTAGKEIRLDYLMHFAEYGILTFLTFLSFAGMEFKFSYRKVLLIVGGLMALAIADEFHQKLIPGRSFNYMDIMSNLSGIVFISIITLVIFRSLRFRPMR
jgi:VanZ family protein